MLPEGVWGYRVDDKKRFQIPSEMRREFEPGGVWLIEPEGYVVLYILDNWRRLLKKVRLKDRQQFRMTRQPMTKRMDPQWRMRIPKYIIKLGKLGPNIVLISVPEGGYLKVLNQNGANQKIGSNPRRKEKVAGIEPMTQEEAIQAMATRERVRVVINGRGEFGQVTGRQGDNLFGFESFDGKIRETLPYWRFYST